VLGRLFDLLLLTINRFALLLQSPLAACCPVCCPVLSSCRCVRLGEGGDGDGGSFLLNPCALSVRELSATAAVSVATFSDGLAPVLLLPKSASDSDDVVVESLS
jgi:hypothetical protein